MIERWSVNGSYFEACNCEVICPCRQVGEASGGLSTYGHCDFALSWWVEQGHADDIDLAERQVVMVGRYRDDEATTPPDELMVWEVGLYIDDGASTEQYDALADVFLGRAGGQTMKNYAAAIGTVHEVRRSRIDLDHEPGSQRIATGDGAIVVEALEPAEAPGPVSCAIPGHDHPGTEYFIDEFRVAAPNLQWSLRGRCGFATEFAYAGP